MLNIIISVKYIKTIHKTVKLCANKTLYYITIVKTIKPCANKYTLDCLKIVSN